MKFLYQIKHLKMVEKGQKIVQKKHGKCLADLERSFKKSKIWYLSQFYPKRF